MQIELSKKRTSCRVCNGSNLHKILSLGDQPPANAFLRKDELSKPELKFPLDLLFCASCSFVQIADVVSPEVLFKNYPYASSTSPTFVAHFKELAETVCKRLGLQQDSLIVDIGSNDGILLRPFKEKGMRVIGIDPAENIAEIARKNGVETITKFFSPGVAQEIASLKGKAQVITATSVFPHIDNLDNVAAGIRELLADDGVFIIEAYYLLDLLEKNLFDTIYHEHLSYFSVKTINDLLSRLSLRVFDVEKTDTHGGSIRVFAQKLEGKRPVQASVQEFIARELGKGLDSLKIYSEFATRIDENKQQLTKLLRGLKADGNRICGYGAAAKANTLLNYFGLGTDILEYIVDDSPLKQGLFAPGSGIPVVSSEELQKNPPDYILILAWNFANPIMRKMQKYKFIIPVPRPQIVTDVVSQDLFAIAEGIAQEAKMLEGKTLLITGGSGFIGSYIVTAIDFLNKNLFARPCKVISIDNHMTGSKKKNLVREIESGYIKFIEHDIRTPLVLEEQIDYVISAVGIASPTYYKKFPIETIEGTVFGLKHILELARVKKVKGLLYFSSSEIYGDPDPRFVPTPETYKGHVSSIGPRSCYDESKRLGEALCVAYQQVHNIPVKIVRPFNIYGPGMSTKDFRVIPKFLAQGLQGQPLTIHSHGKQTRSFCYVADAIIGFFKVLLSGRSGEVYNVGNNSEEVNMNVLAKTISEAVFEGKVPVTQIQYPDSYPQDEPTRRCPDLTKIKSELGYTPNVDLKTGLKRTYFWLKNNII